MTKPLREVWNDDIVINVINRYQQGDVESFNEIYPMLQSLIQYWMMRYNIVGDDDCISDALIDLNRAMVLYDSNRKTTPYKYLGTTARHAVMNYLKKRNKRWDKEELLISEIIDNIPDRESHNESVTIELTDKMKKRMTMSNYKGRNGFADVIHELLRIANGEVQFKGKSYIDQLDIKYSRLSRFVLLQRRLDAEKT
jgi:DNA-directed RNA polymerase specialized sigma24 family protein